MGGLRGSSGGRKRWGGAQGDTRGINRQMGGAQEMGGSWGRRGHLRVDGEEEPGVGGSPGICLQGGTLTLPLPSMGPLDGGWGQGHPWGYNPGGENPLGRARTRSWPWANGSTSPPAPCLSFPFQKKKRDDSGIRGQGSSLS